MSHLNKWFEGFVWRRYKKSHWCPLLAAVIKHTGCVLCLLFLVSQSCLTLCDPVNYSPSGSLSLGILQARILERVAMPSCRGSSHPLDWTQVSCIAARFFTIWVTREAYGLMGDLNLRVDVIENKSHVWESWIIWRVQIEMSNLKKIFIFLQIFWEYIFL